MLSVLPGVVVTAEWNTLLLVLSLLPRIETAAPTTHVPVRSAMSTMIPCTTRCKDIRCSLIANEPTNELYSLAHLHNIRL